MNLPYPRRDLYAFVWATFVFFVTYLMRGANGFKLFLISDIFNCGEDTILIFSIRWALWLSVPIVLFQSIRSRVGVGYAIFSLVAWWITVISGIQPAVFEVSFDQVLQKRLKYFHYGASGVVMATAGFSTLRLGLKTLGRFWILSSILYCIIFLINHFNEKINISRGYFSIIEYSYYFIFITNFTFSQKEKPSHLSKESASDPDS